VAAARAQRLATTAEWLRLGHWRSRRLGGYESDVDGPTFFLARDGKRAPEAELESTLRALFAPAPPASAGRPPAEVAAGAGASPPGVSTGAHAAGAAQAAGATPRRIDFERLHARCRFPARWRWLQRRLGLRLPEVACPDLEQFRHKTAVETVSLVFSSYYLNNPSSAFGHLFLRLARRGHASGRGAAAAVSGEESEREELLDYGVDFSADVDTKNMLVYAWRGLTGAFRGTFKVLPYFYKVREYNDYESRDLWQYELALTAEERQRLVDHLWELGATYFDYFYVSENCAYQIMALLEAASWRLSVLDHAHWPVIPADIVKELQEARLYYRPSLRHQLQARFERLSRAQARTAVGLVESPRAAETVPLPPAWSPAQQADVLDAAEDLVDFRHAKELVFGSERAAELKQRLLERRAALLVATDTSPMAPMAAARPDHGHPSHRAGTGLGVTHDRVAGGQQLMQTIDLRLALHDLADPSTGYPELAQIECLATRLRLLPEARRVELDDLALFRVWSLTAQQPYDRKASWRVEVGATTLRDRGCHGCLAGKLAGGGGVAASFARDRWTLFALADTQLLYTPSLAGGDTVHSLGRTGIRLGIGPLGGLRLRWTHQLITLFTAAASWLPAQEPTWGWQGTAVVRWQLVDRLALSVEATVSESRADAQLLALLYF
jgi:hypothetical protein